MNLKYFAKNWYNQCQTVYIAPAVADYWDQPKSSCWAECNDKEIILSSNGQNDSPCHSEQYCTYTFAEMDLKHILDMKIVDVWEEGRNMKT